MRSGQVPLLGGQSSLARGLVGYWSFDEAAGSTVHDRSGNGNNGTWSGTLGSQWGAGKIGSGGVFNGTDNAVNCGAAIFNQLTGSAVSIAVWMNLTTSTGQMSVVGTNTSFSQGLAFYLRNTAGAEFGMQFNPNGTNSSGALGNIPTTGVWTHVVAAFSGTQWALYQSGALVASVTATQTSVGRAPDFLSIGFIANTAAPRYFPGSLDELGIWNRALTANEVSQLYNAGQGLRPI